MSTAPPARCGSCRAATSEGRNEPSIEWPESRDQRDNVRRLVEQIKLEADGGGTKAQVRAIGVIGTDVNDKLLLVQALRASFSDRVLFTTDIDARLLHPEAVRYTRNLIVASSLPLALDDEILDQKLRARVAPFRDMYQTATFLGARYASADDKQASLLHPAIEKRLEKPILYEIGRDSEVELGIDKVLEHERDRRFGYALLAGGLLLVSAASCWGDRRRPCRSRCPGTRRRQRPSTSRPRSWPGWRWEPGVSPSGS